MKKGFYRYAQCAVWVLMTCAGIYGLLLACSIALNPVMLIKNLLGTATPAIVEETLSLPVNTVSDVLTLEMYSGHVTITITGKGQIDVNTQHDTFRSYRSDGVVRDFNGFLIDGQGLLLRVFTLAPTRTNRATSEYKFDYYVSEQPRRIPFRMVNGNPDDTSVFAVHIYSITPRPGSGR